MFPNAALIDQSSGALLPTLQLTTSHSQRLNSGKPLGTCNVDAPDQLEERILQIDQSKNVSKHLQHYVNRGCGPIFIANTANL